MYAARLPEKIDWTGDRPLQSMSRDVFPALTFTVPRDSDTVIINTMDLQTVLTRKEAGVASEHVSPETDEEGTVTEYPAAPARDHPDKR